MYCCYTTVKKINLLICNWLKMFHQCTPDDQACAPWNPKFILWTYGLRIAPILSSWLLAAQSRQLTTALRLLDLTAPWHHRSRHLLLYLEWQFGLTLLVPFLPVRQVFPCAMLQPVILRCLHCVLCLTRQNLGPCFLSFTWRTLPIKLSSTKWTCMIILSCIGTVVSMIQLLLSHGRRSALTLMMSATGWLPTASSWAQRRPNYSGLGRGTILRLSLEAVVCRCSLAQRLSLQVTTSVF